MCGWLKDKYGLSWQIVPSTFRKFLSGKKQFKSYAESSSNEED